MNDQGIAVKKHNYICVYNDVPTTCFGRFLTGHHQVGIQCQKNYIPTISIDISISVSTDKGGGRDLVYKYRVCG